MRCSISSARPSVPRSQARRIRRLRQHAGGGFSTRRGRHGALLYRDSVTRSLRPRKGAALTSITSGGRSPTRRTTRWCSSPRVSRSVRSTKTLPSKPAGRHISIGQHSYRICAWSAAPCAWKTPTVSRRRFRSGWRGAGRSDELSAAVARLRTGNRAASRRRCRRASHAAAPHAAASRWLIETVGIDEIAAAQLIEYLAAGRAALQGLPTLDTVIFERFSMNPAACSLVIHSSYGSRGESGLGLSLRKRFCRTFNFEAAGGRDRRSIVLSLTHAHSFELSQARPLPEFEHGPPRAGAGAVRGAMFGCGGDGPPASPWRCRGSGRQEDSGADRADERGGSAGVRVSDQVASPKNLPGEIEIPDHPLVRQTSATAWRARWMSTRSKRYCGAWKRADSDHARDLTEPSPLALEP